MPYLSSKIKIEHTIYDRRIKLTDEDKESIKQMYINGAAIRAIARHFCVDKRNIQFLLFPERKEKNIMDRKARGGTKQYYDKDKWKETQKEHRHYKQNLYMENKIKGE